MVIMSKYVCHKATIYFLSKVFYAHDTLSNLHFSFRLRASQMLAPI